MKTFRFKVVLCLLAVLSVAVAASAASVFPKFKANGLTGGEVSQEVFAGKKLTMINFWGMYCPPCIAEMPDLGRLGKSMPEGTQLMGIVIDVGGNKQKQEKALSILKKANADFPNVIMSPEMDAFTQTLVGVPTTIFVDAKGNIVGEPIVGSRSEKDYRDELAKALKLLK